MGPSVCGRRNTMVEYAKMSKKAKRAHDLRKRGSWGGLNPVTRKPTDPRAYNRAAQKRQLRAGL